MYITASSSASSSLLRAASSYSRTGLFPSFRNLSPIKTTSPSLVNHHRSLAYAAVRSFHCSVSRWSDRLDWRSPLSLRAQIRTVNPFIERLERKFATMAAEHPFKAVLTSLQKPGGGEFGKFYSLPALNDPRIAHDHGFAWCCWIQVIWKIKKWRDSYRLGSNCDTNAEEAWCCWQSC